MLNQQQALPQRQSHLQELIADEALRQAVVEVCHQEWAVARQDAVYKTRSSIFQNVSTRVMSKLAHRLIEEDAEEKRIEFSPYQNQPRIIIKDKYNTDIRILCRKGTLAENGFILSGVGSVTSDLIDSENALFHTSTRLFDLPSINQPPEFKNVWIVMEVLNFDIANPLLHIYLAFPDSTTQNSHKIEADDFIAISEEPLSGTFSISEDSEQPNTENIDFPLEAQEG